MDDILSKILGTIDVEEQECESEMQTVQGELDSESRTELSEMGLSESQVEEMMDAYYRECGEIKKD